MFRICTENPQKEVEAMLSGEYKHTLDAKNRIFIPAKHREELGAKFVVARNIRGNYLRVYSEPEWEKFIEPIKKLDRKLCEDTLRFLNRNAESVSPDAQGRIVLPQGLVEHAKIIKGAVIVGCGSYDEIWAEELYSEAIENEDQEAIRAALEACGL